MAYNKVLTKEERERLRRDCRKEGVMFHELQVLGMTYNLQEKVCGLCSKTLKDCNSVQLLAVSKHLKGARKTSLIFWKQ